MTEHDKEYERILKEIRLNRQMKRKRLFEQAARARRAEIVAASKEIPNERV
jgi:hypothetical protein